MTKKEIFLLIVIFIFVFSATFLFILIVENNISKYYLDKKLKYNLFVAIYFFIKNIIFSNKILFLIPIALIISSGLIIYFSLTNVKKPILEFTEAVKRVSDGDFTTQISLNKMSD